MAKVKSPRAMMTKKNFFRAIHNSDGVMSTIADRVGCSWTAARNFIERYPDVAEAYNDELERSLDKAEKTIHKSISMDNTADAKWWLAKKGKHRGYGDSLELSGPDGGEIPIKITIDR